MVTSTIQNEPKVCKQCLQLFIPKRRRGPLPHYCSQRCKDLFHHPQVSIKIHICKQCNIAFQSRYKNSTYCSKQCRSVAWYVYVQERDRFHVKGSIMVRECRQCYSKTPMTWNQRICKSCRRKNRHATELQRDSIKRGAFTSERFSRLEIFERDNWRCQHCRKKVSLIYARNDKRFPHLDHIIPLSLGGLHTKANVQCLCRYCNLSKNNRIQQEQLRLF